MNIEGREIGPGHRPYIIAEVSCNHGGNLERALELIDAAKSCGADAVKFQCFEPQTITLDCDRPEFIVEDGPWKGRRLYDLYTLTCTPFDFFPKIKERAAKTGITWFASVFDDTAVDLMIELDAPAMKIASFEIVDIPLIRYAAAAQKPLIISTGMASPEEVSAAHWAVVEGLGPNADYMFLDCVSGYPTPINEVGLRNMNGVSGISDHTMCQQVPIAATALGAAIIEKHFRLSWHPDTEDAPFSFDEVDFATMVENVHLTWQALQDTDVASEQAQRPLRRSLFAVEDIQAGEMFSDLNVKSIRPGHGLRPIDKGKVIGRYATRDITRGEPMTWDMVR